MGPAILQIAAMTILFAACCYLFWDATRLEKKLEEEQIASNIKYNNLSDRLRQKETGHPISKGIQRIHEERIRQSLVGYSDDHDDSHDREELAQAASCYAWHWTSNTGSPPPNWPFKVSEWKPSPDRIRNLAKAGALIAAEIDRMLRAKQREPDANIDESQTT